MMSEERGRDAKRTEEELISFDCGMGDSRKAIDFKDEISPDKTLGEVAPMKVQHRTGNPVNKPNCADRSIQAWGGGNQKAAERRAETKVSLAAHRPRKTRTPSGEQGP